jgi:hypothetical protein
MSVVSAETIGGASKEWVMFRANRAINTRFVMVSDTTYTGDGKISNKLRHVFWLPDIDLNAGDFFAMSTMTGKPSFSALPGGARMYHHYLNLDEPIWNDLGDRVTLFFLDEWETSAVHGRRLRLAA